MFERYTERARQVLFFSRYEASQVWSATIETEHVLLGLIREGKGQAHRVLVSSAEWPQAVQREINARTVTHSKLGNPHIGTEHLLLGILREVGSKAASILVEHALDLETARKAVRQLPPKGSLRPDKTSRRWASAGWRVKPSGSYGRLPSLHVIRSGDTVMRMLQKETA